MQCPKRVSPNHTHNLLIFQDEYWDDRLTKKAYFAGQIPLRGKITRIPNIPQYYRKAEITTRKSQERACCAGRFPTLKLLTITPTRGRKRMSEIEFFSSLLFTRSCWWSIWAWLVLARPWSRRDASGSGPDVSERIPRICKGVFRHWPASH